jgi:hypothetical protein
MSGTDAFLQVNRFGRRFYNEDSDTEACQRPANRVECGWSSTTAGRRRQAWDRDSKGLQVTDRVGRSSGYRRGKGRGPGAERFEADTIEELATKMKVPVETFKATIALQ